MSWNILLIHIKYKEISSFTLILVKHVNFLFLVQWTLYYPSTKVHEEAKCRFHLLYFKLSWAKVILMLLFLSGIKNPVLVARRLLSETQKGKLSAGRIPPWWAELSDVGFPAISLDIYTVWHTSLMPQGKYSGVKQQHFNHSMQRIHKQELTLCKTKHAWTKCLYLVVTNVASVFS